MTLTDLGGCNTGPLATQLSLGTPFPAWKGMCGVGSTRVPPLQSDLLGLAEGATWPEHQQIQPAWPLPPANTGPWLAPENVDCRRVPSMCD